VEFLEVSKKLVEPNLKEVEEQLGITFTDEFKEHYLKYNGGYPLKSFLLWPDDGAKTRINHFFSIKYDGFSRLETAYENLFITEQILPEGFLPFAVDDGGDYFCISTLPQYFNQVFFFDMHHYDPDRIDGYITFISASFREFIENLVDE
jgi:hypothetical protein